MTSHRAPKPSLRSRIIERIVSGPSPAQRLRARHFGLDFLLRRPPVLELYYEPGDPHSHLAAQLLPTLQQRLGIPIAIRIVGESDPEVYPEAAKQRQFALTDAGRIAPAWGLRFPEAAPLPTAEARFQAAQILLACKDLKSFQSTEAALAPRLFNGEPLELGSATVPVSTARAMLTSNHQRRARLGHYLPGMWHCNGNWYWGVDRLDHLEADLRQGGWLSGPGPLAHFDATRANLPAISLENATLEFFFSFRSPYSYLAVEALRSRGHRLPVPLRIRPVLPMAMRGMKIPPAKGLYIARDVKREARKDQIAFGRIADPLGVATERCLTLFNLLENTPAQLEFLHSHCQAVWSEGIDVATDDGLRFVWERAGQAWSSAAEKLAAGFDLALAETNRQALFEAGCWGVPSFRLGNFVTWGNDRIWMLHEILRRAHLTGS